MTFPYWDAATRTKMQEIFGIWQTMFARRKDFLRAPHARIIEIPGASHYLHYSNREAVLSYTKAFLASEP